ncbi:MAG: alpha/beta fold hydrolase [Rhodocyclaceae bacterium]
MKRIVFCLALVCGALWAQSAQAHVVLLVHGYLGDALSWERSGVNDVLAANGWPRAGVIVPGPAGPALPPPVPTGPNRAYSIELPSTAPLALQSDMLLAALRALETRHANEPITLVGHSAGGVVARMALVRGGPGRVVRLVTIAAPNLGTERALQALDATHGGGPFGLVRDVFGGGAYRAVKHSWPVLMDLAPAIPGSTLHWLNGHRHPEIRYVSIVRGAGFGFGDLLVPGFSQDLNNVPPLHGRAVTYVVPAEHNLVPPDGTMIAQVLAGA